MSNKELIDRVISDLEQDKYRFQCVTETSKNKCVRDVCYGKVAGLYTAIETLKEMKAHIRD